MLASVEQVGLPGSSVSGSQSPEPSAQGGQQGTQQRQEQYTACGALRLEVASHWPHTEAATGASVPGTQQSLPFPLATVSALVWQWDVVDVAGSWQT